MRDLATRKVWLAILAAGNLILWGGVAIAVWLIASDRLDLGIESSVREYQATALAAWSENRAAAHAAGPADPEGSPARPRPLPGGSGAPTDENTVPADSKPPTGVLEIASVDGSGAEATPAAPAPPEAWAGEPPAAADGSAADEPQLTAPLIMADPALDDLSAMDQEMSRSAAGRMVQIRYFEESLNREIAALLASRTDLPYRDVSVDLGTEQVIVRGDVLVLGLTIQAELRGHVVARDCRPQFDLASVKVGRLFTPVVIRDQVGELLDEAMAWYPDNYALCIDRIVTQDDRATLYGHRR